MKRVILLALLALCVLPASASAQQGMLDLGPTPWKCNFGNGGCYGSDSGEGALDDTGVADVKISPHHVRPGELLTVTAAEYSVWQVNWDNTSHPGLTELTNCENTETSCTYVAGGTSGSWLTYRMTFPGCPNVGCPDADYYAITDAYAIEGTVMNHEKSDPAKLFPAVNTKVTAVGAKGTYSATTNRAGAYTIFLPPDDTYKVTTAGRHCIKDDLPTKCTTSKSLKVAPDHTLNFESPPLYKVTGTVKDVENNPVADVPVRAAAVEGGAMVGTALSKADGSYTMTLPLGNTRFSSGDPHACVLAGSGTQCTKTRDVPIDSPTTVNLRIEGCVAKIDFGTRMIAKGPCFDIVEKDKQWTTTEPFWMNGLRLHPTGEVTLDKPLQTISAPGPVTFKLRTPGGEEWPFLVLPTVALNFSQLAKELLPSELTGVNNAMKVGGALVKGTGKLEWKPGSTELTLQLDLAETQWQIGDDWTTGFAEKNKRSFAIKTTLENDVGLRNLTASFTPPEGVVFPPGASNAKGKRFVTLKQLTGAYDFVTNVWRFGGKVQADFLSQSPKVLLGVDKPTVEGYLDISSGFVPVNVSAKGENLDRRLPWGLYLQKLRFAIGADGLVKDSPFAITAGVGVSLGPSVNKKQLASAEGDLTLSDADRNYETLGDLMLSGKGSLSVFMHKLLEGKIEIIPGQASVLGEGTATLDVPVTYKGIDAGRLGVRGTSAAWFDGINSEFGGEGSGSMSLPGLGSLGVRWVANDEVIAGCLTDTVFKDPDPRIGGVLVPVPETRDLYGVLKRWDEPWLEIIGCDLSAYQKARPKPKAETSASSERFTVPKGTTLLGVDVTGKGPWTVKGASGTARIVAAADGGVRKNWIHALPSEQGMTFVLLKPKPGSYTIAGSVSKLRFAEKAPEPEVGGVLTGGGCGPVLNWSARKIPGQEIEFIDAGADSAIALGSSKKPRGKIKLAAGALGRRTIVAKVFQGGVLRDTFVLDSYDGVSTLPPAPSAVRAKRGGGKVKLSWDAACGAAGYVVSVGSKVLSVTPKPRATVKTKAKQIRITSVSAAGAPGGSALAH